MSEYKYLVAVKTDHGNEVWGFPDERSKREFIRNIAKEFGALDYATAIKDPDQESRPLDP